MSMIPPHRSWPGDLTMPHSPPRNADELSLQPAVLNRSKATYDLTSGVEI